ncbi:MAG: hypothetical protein JWN49_678 [Parcubacteria group bacterium]|nr:hypothetical protein [Parcubacteria group bacterium]
MVPTVQNATDYLIGQQPKIDPATLSAADWDRVITHNVRKNVTLKYLRRLRSFSQILSQRNRLRAETESADRLEVLKARGIKPDEVMLECGSYPSLPTEHAEWPTIPGEGKYAHLLIKKPVPITEHIILLRRHRDGTHQFMMLSVVWEVRETYDDSSSVVHLEDWWVEARDIRLEKVTSLTDVLARKEFEGNMPVLATRILRALAGAQNDTEDELGSVYRSSRQKRFALETVLERLGL